MSAKDKSAIIIFAKYPIENFVKTRLETPILTSKDTLALYKAFLKDTIIQSLITTKVDKVILSLTHLIAFKTEKVTGLDFFQSDPKITSDKIHSKFHVQPEGSFGERMASAVLYCRDLGYHKIIVLGADGPQIQPRLLDDVIDELEIYDVILGPSPAGGIYLIGITNNFDVSGFIDVFEGVELLKFVEETLSQNLSCHIIQEMTDIDTEEDLIGLIAWLQSVKLLQPTQNTISIPKNTLSSIRKLGLQITTERADNRKKKITKRNSK